MEKEGDRRAVRTKNALKNAMLAQMKRKDISRITVSELADAADVGRGTFYLHYADPYDLLDKIEDELVGKITEYTSPVINHMDNESLLTHLENIWRYIFENMETFKVLMGPGYRGRFMEKFKIKCIESVIVSLGGAELKQAELYSIIYVVSGTLGIYERWMEEGPSAPPDQVARIIRNLIVGR